MEEVWKPGFIMGGTSLLITTAVSLYFWKKLSQTTARIEESQETVIRLRKVEGSLEKKVKDLSARVAILEREMEILNRSKGGSQGETFPLLDVECDNPPKKKVRFKESKHKSPIVEEPSEDDKEEDNGDNVEDEFKAMLEDEDGDEE